MAAASTTNLLPTAHDGDDKPGDRSSWRLSSLWSPVPTPDRVASYHQNVNGEWEAPHWSQALPPVPTIEPRSYDALGAIHPDTGMTLGTYAYEDSRHRHQSSWYSTGSEMRDLGEDDSYTRRDLSFDVGREEVELGSVQRRPSAARQGSYSLSRQPSTSKVARQLSQTGSFRRNPSFTTGSIKRELSKRQQRNKSRVLSTLQDMPEDRDSVTLRDSTSGSEKSGAFQQSEKRTSLLQPARPIGPPGGGPPSGGPPSGMPPGFGPPSGPPDPDLVLWDGPEDSGNPMNWSRSRKWASTVALAFVTFCITFASSSLSPGTQQAAKEFGVSDEVMILATALFVLGFAFGPVVWGPLSELYGRKRPLFFGVTVFAIFQVPVAVAQNLETVFVCRFLAGFFGCSPLVIVGGAMADFWAPIDRGVAVSIFSLAAFLGPCGGPIVGGYLVETPGYGWRWTAWVTLFATAFFGCGGWLVYRESFGPVLLQQRAKKMRYATKNWAIHAPADEIEISLSAILNKYLAKPFLMLVFEPILLLMTIYISFIYGILYLFFEVYPISFIIERGFSDGAGGLPFLAVMIGVVFGGLVNFAFIRTRYVRIAKEKGRVPPEERLVPMMVGSLALPAGLFWFAWTSDPSINYWPQIIAGIPVGCGICLIFVQGINYIVDVYMWFSNSALSANTIPRSIFGAAFPMFAVYMYNALGVKWATSVLAFVSCVLIPVPFLFFNYGARIRQTSRYTPKLPPGGMGPPGGPGGPGGPPKGMNGPPTGMGGPAGMQEKITPSTKPPSAPLSMNPPTPPRIPENAAPLGNKSLQNLKRPQDLDISATRGRPTISIPLPGPPDAPSPLVSPARRGYLGLANVPSSITSRQYPWLDGDESRASIEKERMSPPGFLITPPPGGKF